MNIEKLEKLNELKEKGILTEEEFQREKSKILSETPTPTSPQSLGASEKKANPMATAGLVVALVGLFLLPIVLGILAIVFGSIGINKDRNTYKGYGNSLAAIIIGVVDFIWGFFYMNLFF